MEIDSTTSGCSHFGTFVEQGGTRIALLRQPEDLVFDEMPARPVDAFSALMAPAD